MKLNENIFFQTEKKTLDINDESSFSIFSLNLRERQNSPFYFLNPEPINQLCERNMEIGQFLTNNSPYHQESIEVQNFDNLIEFQDYEKKQTLPKQEIKKRNRESAKNCRKKKKQYIQKLQEECMINRKKIKSLNIKVRELQNQLNQIKYSNTFEKQTFTDISKICYQKLQQLLKDNQKDQIEAYILEMKRRFGPAGKDRTNLLNYYMSQFMENMLADFQKYFISSVLKGRGLWGKQQDQFDKEVRQILCLSQEKKRLLIKKSYSQVHKQAVLYHQICQKIYQNYSALAIQAKNLQETMISVKEDLQMKNMGKVVVFFQQNKHRHQIRRLKQQWIQSFRIDEEVSQVVSSKLKKKYKTASDDDYDQ